MMCVRQNRGVAAGERVVSSRSRVRRTALRKMASTCSSRNASLWKISIRLASTDAWIRRRASRAVQCIVKKSLYLQMAGVRMSLRFIVHMRKRVTPPVRKKTGALKILYHVPSPQVACCLAVSQYV